MDRLILTARPEFWDAALDELRTVAGRYSDVVELRDDIRCVRLTEPFTGWKQLPIFIRHAFPVLATVEKNIDAVLDALQGHVGEQTIGIQVRTLPGANVGRAEFAEELGSRLGADVDLQRADLIVSVLVHHDTIDVGVATPADNLSAWSGGERRFKRYEGQINRSEFKLLEALDVFGIAPSGSALDLGAAPGGWSKVLADAGCDVVAVDPADLDERLPPRVRHFRGTTGEFMRAERKDRYDLIVNDMRMDARMSARTQVSLADHLTPSGLAVMTLKIGRRAPLAEVRDAVRVLRRAYEVRGVRQLFHNRNEVTAHLAKRR
jgi:23S rRNA (cytidine2498-2'-O)-methyltransferase